MVYVYHDKLNSLRAQSYEYSFCLPFCRTIASVIEMTPQDGMLALLAELENSQFRSINISVFSRDGEVWADSLQPSQGKLPLPPSEWQTRTFKTIHDKVMENKRGVVQTLFRPCSPKSSAYETTFLSAVYVESKDMIVVTVQCGNE